MFSTENYSEFKHLLKEKKFMSSKSYEERVEYILTKVKPIHQFIEDTFKWSDLYVSYHTKSLGNSRSFQSEGHHYFERKRYKLAKMCFTYVSQSSSFE